MEINVLFNYNRRTAVRCSDDCSLFHRLWSLTPPYKAPSSWFIPIISSVKCLHKINGYCHQFKTPPRLQIKTVGVTVKLPRHLSSPVLWGKVILGYLHFCSGLQWKLHGMVHSIFLVLSDYKHLNHETKLHMNILLKSATSLRCDITSVCEFST